MTHRSIEMYRVASEKLEESRYVALAKERECSSLLAFSSLWIVTYSFWILVSVPAVSYVFIFSLWCGLLYTMCVLSIINASDKMITFTPLVPPVQTFFKDANGFCAMSSVIDVFYTIISYNNRELHYVNESILWSKIFLIFMVASSVAAVLLILA